MLKRNVFRISAAAVVGLSLIVRLIAEDVQICSVGSLKAYDSYDSIGHTEGRNPSGPLFQSEPNQDLQRILELILYGPQ